MNIVKKLEYGEKKWMVYASVHAQVGHYLEDYAGLRLRGAGAMSRSRRGRGSSDTATSMLGLPKPLGRASVLGSMLRTSWRRS
jgi:hypothetical protein